MSVQAWIQVFSVDESIHNEAHESKICAQCVDCPSPHQPIWTIQFFLCNAYGIYPTTWIPTPRKHGWYNVVFKSRGCADSPVTTPMFYSVSLQTISSKLWMYFWRDYYYAWGLLLPSHMSKELQNKWLCILFFNTIHPCRNMWLWWILMN